MKSIGLTVLAALAVAASASADSVTMSYLGHGNPSTAGLRYNNRLTWSARSSATFSNVSIGSQQWSVYGQQRTTFCVQLFEGVTAGNSYTYTILPPSQVPDMDAPVNAPGPMGPVKATLVNDLYRRYYAGLSGAQSVGAFQLALWEITHENIDARTASEAVTQLGLDRGAFQVNQLSGTYRTAASMLSSLGEGGFGTMSTTFHTLTNQSAQDQLMVVPIGAPAVLAGLGLIGVGLMRRRVK